MTNAAKEFITPLTMQAVSGRPVSDSLLDPAAEASMGHIELAKWADLVLLAPATADLIARMTAGMGNDLLTTLVLATDAPVAVSPAMNQQMYSHPATQENIATLKRRGCEIWGPCCRRTSVWRCRHGAHARANAARAPLRRLLPT